MNEYKPSVAPGTRWRDKNTGAAFNVVQVKDSGMLVWCQWEASGELFCCDGMDFYSWDRFTPLDRGQTW